MTKILYPQWQVLEDYSKWSVDLQGKIVGVRFGQWFCNHHDDVHQDNKLFYMTDNTAALEYILQTYSEPE